MSEPITIRTDVDVDLIRASMSDEYVIEAMRVSTKGAEVEEQTDPKLLNGRINFLMKNRHGCYDSQTEVLTAEGWKFWPAVTGAEQFLTLNLATDEIEYQAAERLVRKSVNEPMVSLQMSGVDALVTTDHNMVSAPRTHEGWSYGLHPAKDFLLRSHKVRLGGGEWCGELETQDAALIGFAVADGNVNNGTLTFHLRKDRKIEWLQGLGYEIYKNHDAYTVRGLSEQTKLWLKDTYLEDGSRQVPRELLLRGSAQVVQDLLDGYLQGDGHVSAMGKVTASTTSRQLVDDLMELAVKCGRAAVETAAEIKRVGAYGTKPLYRLSFYADRNLEPRVGWTSEARQEQVKLVAYEGEVHCVTVPNGTLYVRRNGKPMWCGNTPFEHNSATFRISAPIFVWREFHRHRIGISYNEESGRYKVLDPVFYVPGTERNLVQNGKPGAYTFAPGTPEQHLDQMNRLCESYSLAYRNYLAALEAGIAKEVARMCLPVAIYSTCYVTLNARSLMAVLSLRTRRENSRYPSFPQREIEMCVEQMEALWAPLMPITAAAFDAHGRVAP